MNNLNSVLIEGELTEDLVLDKTAKGSPVCNFTIVSTRCYKGETGMEKEEGYFHIRAGGKLAEEAVNLGRKDRSVRVVGRLKQERRTGPDGRPQSGIVIIAEHVEFTKEQRLICDRCGRDIEQDWYYGKGPVCAGNCTGCGDNLCKDCAVSWDEDGRCKSCREKDRKEE